ncbi:MAG: leucine-rich repeat domain-containing protein [Clostridiales bacterium]|nr:leucine-rich repeat domain-containing protein [Clostridiales bacterium]
MSVIDIYDGGAWRIDSQIGEGSYGKVFKVVKLENGAERFAALKIIPVPKSDQDLARLRAEGYEGESLRIHIIEMAKGILKAFDYIQDFRGAANIVSYEDQKILPKVNEPGYYIIVRMELLENLDQIMKTRRLSETGTVKLADDICRALDLLAMGSGIHGDIKPENILLSKNGDYKLSDFGIAKQLEQSMPGGFRKVSRAFMSPEAINGKWCGTPADLYSLGMIMYMILNNGRGPFLPTTSASVSASEREAAFEMRMSGARFAPPVNASPELAKVILTACAFEPESRYTSAEAMINALAVYHRTMIEKAEAADPKSRGRKNAAPPPPSEKPPLLDPAGVPYGAKLISTEGPILTQANMRASFAKRQQALAVSEARQERKSVPMPDLEPKKKKPLFGKNEPDSPTPFLSDADPEPQRNQPFMTGMSPKPVPFMNEAKPEPRRAPQSFEAKPEPPRKPVIQEAKKAQFEKPEQKKPEPPKKATRQKNNDDDEMPFFDKVEPPRKSALYQSARPDPQIRPDPIQETMKPQPRMRSVDIENPNVNTNEKKATAKIKKKRKAKKSPLIPALATIAASAACIVFALSTFGPKLPFELPFKIPSISGLVEESMNLGKFGSEKGDLADGEVGIKGKAYQVTAETLDLSSEALVTADLEQIGLFKNLSTLDLRSCGVTDISPVKGMASLARLDLTDNEISDVTPLETLENLSSLELSLNPVSDLSPLTNIQTLTELSVSTNQDLSVLRGLPSLRKLELVTSGMTDLNTIAGLNLEELYVQNFYGSDISPLFDFTNLQKLYLIKLDAGDADRIRNSNGDLGPKEITKEGLRRLAELYRDPTAYYEEAAVSEAFYQDSMPMDLADISHIAGLKSLTELYLSGNSIDDIRAVGGLSNLNTLHLANNYVSDITSLPGLVNLRSLYLYDNTISDISALSDLVNLETLYLFRNQVNDLNPLAPLANLETLYLFENGIENLAPLYNLTNLKELWLGRNQISDISALSGMHMLSDLRLDSNQISDVSALSGIHSLKYLDLRDNPISEDSINELRAALPECEIVF